MAIVRIGRLHAEDRVVTPIDHPTIGGLNNTIAVSTTQKHSGSYSYDINNRPCFGPPIPTPLSAYRYNYFLWNSGNGDSNRAVFVAAAGLTVPYESPTLYVNLDFTLEELTLRRPVSGTTDSFDTLVTASAPASLLATSAWIQAAVTHKIDASDGFFALRINGVKVLELLGDTRLFGQNSGSNLYSTAASHVWGAGGILNSQTWGSGCFVDDCYLDSIVGESDHVPPPRIFAPRFATGAGANAQFTPSTSTNVSCIDDNPNNGDTDYNAAASAGLKDTFQFGAITVPADHRIIRQSIGAYAKGLDAGPEIRFHTYDGSLYDDSADMQLPTDYAIPLYADFETDPDGNPWNQTSVNASQLGYESRGSF